MALTLVILTPSGETARLEAESVRLEACDNASGEGGGSFGIRKGHMPAVAALKENSLARAFTSGRETAAFRISAGFARVENDTVTVIAESAEKV